MIIVKGIAALIVILFVILMVAVKLIDVFNKKNSKAERIGSFITLIALLSMIFLALVK